MCIHSEELSLPLYVPAFLCVSMSQCVSVAYWGLVRVAEIVSDRLLGNEPCQLQRPSPVVRAPVC